MEIKEFLATNPENLAQSQEHALRTYAADKLQKIAKLLLDQKYDEVDTHLAYSPAGDSHGRDNTYISFAELGLSPCSFGGTDSGDIGTVLAKLKHLQSLQKPKKK